MQLLMPSLAFLLAGVAVSFLVLPNFAPAILVTGGLIVMAFAIYLHSQQFGIEYERATWMYQVRQYSSLIMMALIFVGAIGFYFLQQSGAGSSSMFGGEPTGIASVMPPVAMPTVGGGMRNIVNTASSRISELIRKGRITLD